MKKRTTKDFIEEVNIIHNFKYDYSKTVYVKRSDKVIIICPIHGEFTQQANSHLKGHGCSKCKSEDRKLPNNEAKINRKNYMKKYHATHKEKEKQYYEEHKESLLENKRIYDKQNRVVINKKIKDRKSKDVNFKIRKILSARFWKAVKFQKTIKSKRTLEILGCSLEDFKHHLESQFKEGMTWENHGDKGWHIDHIRPCASFDLTDPKQQEECFNYKNMQPLWWLDNIRKGGSY